MADTIGKLVDSLLEKSTGQRLALPTIEFQQRPGKPPDIRVIWSLGNARYDGIVESSDLEGTGAAAIAEKLTREAKSKLPAVIGDEKNVRASEAEEPRQPPSR